MYKKARAGELIEFTGVSAPYEDPENAEIVIDTENMDLDESVKKVINVLNLV